jgi:CRP-like cAMP-binding protein
MEPVARLKQVIDHFSIIPADDWDLLLPHISTRELKKGGLFSVEGKRAHEVGFVINGLFRQYYTVDGEEKTTWFFFEGELLCSYISCLSGKPSLVSIEALEPATYLSFPYSIIEKFYERSLPWSTFGRRVAEYIANGLEDRMVSLLTKKPEERYRELLQSNSQNIIDKIPLQYVANFLGITPVSLSRIRARFYRK